MPPVHTPLTQSPAAAQVLPAVHLLHVAPPQSMSVSLPFFTPSLQVGAWQVPPEQTPLVQSAATLQPFPAVQALQVLPPQSMSVSSWFCTPSVQVGA